MTLAERLEKYFKENEEWNRENWTEPGDKNPWPYKIYDAFLRYFYKNYKATVSYKTWSGKAVTIEVDKDALYDSTTHAWFDCSDIDGCIDTLETWLVDYYEMMADEEILGPIGVDITKK